MPKSKKPARRGANKAVPGNTKPGFQPNQSRLPQTLKQDQGPKGAKRGKPLLFPGRTGGR